MQNPCLFCSICSNRDFHSPEYVLLKNEIIHKLRKSDVLPFCVFFGGSKKIQIYESLKLYHTDKKDKLSVNIADEIQPVKKRQKADTTKKQ